MGMPRVKVRCPAGHLRGRDSAYCRRCGQTYERTAEHRALMSEILTGRRHSWRSGSTKPDVAEKIRSAWTPVMRLAACRRGRRNAADPEWRRKIGEAVSGERSGTWEGGRAQIPYAPGWGRVNRRLVRQRAKFRCERCRKKKPLDTHHKDGSKDNHTLSNLEALCRKCHKVAHAELRRARRTLTSRD